MSIFGLYKYHMFVSLSFKILSCLTNLVLAILFKRPSVSTLFRGFQVMDYKYLRSKTISILSPIKSTAHSTAPT